MNILLGSFLSFSYIFICLSSSFRELASVSELGEAEVTVRSAFSHFETVSAGVWGFGATLLVWASTNIRSVCQRSKPSPVWLPPLRFASPSRHVGTVLRFAELCVCVFAGF